MKKIMGRMKELQQLESDIFDVIQQLHNELFLKRKDQYKLFLVALDTLNEEYCNLTGQYKVHPLDCLKYYENLWRKF